MKEFLNEGEYLVHLLRCAIHQQQPQELPQQLSFPKVYRLSLEHDVANISFYSIEKLKKKPADALYREWELRCDMAVTRDVNQSFARDEILEGFQKAGIRSLEVQGSKIKALYPQPEYRTMSDIDFIIDPENLEKAWKVLEALGYTCKDLNGEEVDGFRPPNINVEIHSEYFPKACEYHSVMRPPFTSVEETGEYDCNDFYVYNILHVAKHYFWMGCGLRRILDVYYLNRHFEGWLDREYVDTLFEKAGVTAFVEEISALAEFWFGSGAGHELVGKMAEYILGSGLNGTYRNEMNNRLRTLCGDGVRFFRLKYVLKRIFVGRACLYERYPQARKRKILLPFYWLHRLFTSIGPERKKRIQTELQAVSASDWKQGS